MVTRVDYRNVVEPLFDDVHDRGERVHFLFDFPAEFERFSFDDLNEAVDRAAGERGSDEAQLQRAAQKQGSPTRSHRGFSCDARGTIFRPGIGQTNESSVWQLSRASHGRLTDVAF